jgi:hypothetical protein
MLAATDGLLTVLRESTETCDISIAAFAKAHPAITLLGQVWGSGRSAGSVRPKIWKPLIEVIGCSVFTCKYEETCIFFSILRTVIFPAGSKVLVPDRFPSFLSFLKGP